MAQQIIAVDVSVNVARIVTIEATLRRASLAGVREMPLDASWTATEVWEHVRESLPEVLDAVVVGMDARLASTRLLQFPFGDLRKAESAVEFELEGQVPYNIEDVATTHYVTKRDAAHVEMLAGMTPKANLTQLLGILGAARIEPRAVVLPAAALGEFLPPGGDKMVGVASLGARESHLAVGQGHLHFARTIRAGGDDIDRAIAAAFSVTQAQARAMKEERGTLEEGAALSADDKKLADCIRSGLSSMVTNLLTTLKALPPEIIPRRFLLTGGLSRLPGLVAYMQSRLGVGVELLDVREAMSFLPGGSSETETGRGTGMAPEYAVALAMAVAQFRHGRDIPLNFRRGDFSYHGDIQLYRGQLMRIAVGTAAVICLAIFASGVKYSMLRSEEKDLDQGFCNATQKIVGKAICDPTAALATLRQAPGAEGASIPSFSASQLYEMLSKSIASDIDVQFDSLDLRVDGTGVQPERLLGKGEAASFELTEQLVAMVKRDACVQDAEVSKLRKTSQGGRVEFNLTVKVLCPAGVQPGTQQQAVATATPPKKSETPAPAATEANP